MPPLQVQEEKRLFRDTVKQGKNNVLCHCPAGACAVLVGKGQYSWGIPFMAQVLEGDGCRSNEVRSARPADEANRLNFTTPNHRNVVYRCSPTVQSFL